MTLYARIQDPTGPFDGLNGWVNAIVDFPDEAALLASVGADYVSEFVEAPHGNCIGWRYEGGVFVEPGGAADDSPRET